MNGDTDEAYNCFKNCNSDESYLPHATYYIAYIDYTRGDLASAKRGFASLAENPAYARSFRSICCRSSFRRKITLM